MTKNLRLSVLDQSPIKAGSTAKEALQETIDLAQLSDELDYYRYWVAEHHASLGPETTEDNFPALTHFPFPLTGAARSWQLR